MEGHTDADVNGGDVIVILIALITGMTGISQLRGFKTYVCECGRLTHTHNPRWACHRMVWLYNNKIFVSCSCSYTVIGVYTIHIYTPITSSCAPGGKIWS